MLQRSQVAVVILGASAVTAVASVPGLPAEPQPAPSAPSASQSARPPGGSQTPCRTDVPDMACIAAGWFVRGSARGFRHNQPQANIWVDTFYMDKTEVTVERFESCVASGACAAVRTIYSDFSRPRQPKVGVSWYDAVRYCEASGKHLPTEAEWEKAARGADGRLYPWGNEPATCERAVIQDHRGRSCGVHKQGGGWDVGRTFEVGSRSPNPYGLYDLAGNAWEWVLDWYSTSYASCGEPCNRANPKGPCDGAEPCRGHSQRVLRGGSWYFDGSQATTIFRRPYVPSNKPYHHFGFRCAASAVQAEALAPKR